MRVRAMAVAAAAACMTLAGAAPAHADQVCLPFDRPYLVVVADKELWLPGIHSLPCQTLD